MTATQDPYDTARADAARIAERSGTERHDVALVLGSGWTSVLGDLGDVVAEIPYGDLAGFPPPSVAGHAGRLYSLTCGDRRLLVLAGRAHLYEGHPPATVVHGVRTAVMSGCGVVVLTNAAGLLRPEWSVGAPVLITDHLNLTGHNPLAGPAPPDALPGRFCDLSTAYSPGLRAIARDVDPSLPEGVYAGVLGPSYETPAEIRMFRALGADLVGMSTVLETIAAVHLGAEVLGIALATNLAAGLETKALEHGDVLATAAGAGERIAALLTGVIARLP